MVQANLQIGKTLNDQNFNTSYVLVQAYEAICRIYAYLFQYIICFGSRVRTLRLCTYWIYFNTSYVLVQGAIDPMTSSMLEEISIHHMFWFKQTYIQNHHIYKHFNTSYVLVQVAYFESGFFIPFFISIHHMFWFKVKIKCNNII